MNKKFVMLIACLIATCAAPAFGEVVSLRDAITRALESNHLLKAATLEQGAAQEEVAASRSRYLPHLYLESGAALSNTPSSVFLMKLDEARINPDSDFAKDTLNHPGARGDFKSALKLEQPLLDFGISADVQLAAKEAEAAKVSLDLAREQVAFRVYNAYLDVRRAKAFRDVADQAVADAREHGRLAEVRERDGVGLKSDQLRTATALSEARQRLISASNDLLLARLRLNLVVGGKQGEALDIGELPGEATNLAELPSQGDLLSLAQKNRPELRAAEKTVEKGELAVQQARNAYLPTIYASAAYQVNDRDLPLGYDNDSWSVGVMLRWELFDGNRRYHQKGKAELGRKASAARLENDRREVALQVTEAVLRRQEAAGKLESARAALQAAQEGVRLVGLRFENGLSPMVELMDAEAALNRSRANLVEVENSYLRSAAQIYFTAGVFMTEVLR
ncbi:MAG TPA: TolC family protein [Geomonas sp.]